MAPVLPDHVIEDILARLPAKSALRCRCLSRAWAATLASGHFVDRHLRLANRRGAPRILILQNPRDGSPPKVHAWSPDHPGGTTLLDAIPHALTRRGRCPTTTPALVKETSRRENVNAPRLVTQQCRGLVILEATGAGTCHVFNPSTGQMAALPEGRPTGCRVKADDLQRYTSLGIGYDARIRRHKVVRVYYRGCDTKKPPGCEVYVVNGSTGLWRPAAGGALEKPAGWVNKNETSVFAQGHVHWLAKRGGLDSPPKDLFIVSFSVTDEKFGALSLPPLDTENYRVLSDQLTDLGGRLCLFRTELKLFSGAPRLYYIWLLRGHETEGTWDLNYRIDVNTLPWEVASFVHDGKGVIPLACADEGRRIVLMQPRHRLSSNTFSSKNTLKDTPSFEMRTYAPGTDDLENLLEHNRLFSNKLMELRHAAMYEESIVSPGQPWDDIIFAMSLVLRELSAHTLARLKCVCRSWRAMIESEDFRELKFEGGIGMIKT